MTPPAWIAIGLLVAALVVVGLGAFRLRALTHRVGSFECGARATGDSSWTLGVAHYGVGRIDWWRCWSLAFRPARTWARHDLVITGREPLSADDARPDDLADRQQRSRVADVVIRDLADVDHGVARRAEIHEGPEAGHVGDHALDDLVLLERLRVDVG